MPKVYAKHAVAENVYDLALARVRDLYDRFDHVAVSFSGGKDSTATMQVALAVAHERGRLPLDVIFYDEEAIPYQTADYVRRCNARDDIAVRWYCLPVRHRNACSRKSPWWSPWDPAIPEKWVRPLPAEAITHLAGFPHDEPDPRLRFSIPEMNGLLFDPQVHGRAVLLMGIRAQESLARTRSVSFHTYDNYLHYWGGPTSKGNVWTASPIYDWTTDDVWTAPATFGWDYNTAYDVMDAAGVSAHAQRCSPAFGEEPIGRLHTYQTCFPEIWDRMVDRVPGAAAALRYARSELWAYGEKPEKPDDWTWPEFLMHYVRKYDPVSQRHVAEKLRMFIGRHYNKTSDPLVPGVAHPDSGLSWAWLLGIAMRGGFKDRTQPVVNPYNDESQRRAYYEALATWQDECARHGWNVLTGHRLAGSVQTGGPVPVSVAGDPETER